MAVLCCQRVIVVDRGLANAGDRPTADRASAALCSEHRLELDG